MDAVTPTTVVRTTDLQPGDVLAAFGADWVSRAISWGTTWPLAPRGLRLGPSHVAIVCRFAPHGILWVESTTLAAEPCRLTGLHCRGIQAHRPESRLAEYAVGGGHVDVYRLSDLDALTHDESEHLAAMVRRLVNAHAQYDYVGAAISGTKLVRLVDGLLLRRWRGLDEVFCSEVLAALLQRLGRMNRDDPTRFSPARLVRRLVREGTYRRLGRLVPQALRLYDGEATAA